MNNKKYSLLLLLVLIAAVFVYLPSFKNNFIWDDYALVVNDGSIKNFSNMAGLFTRHLYREAGGSNFYRPVQALSYMVDYSVWKLNPFGYHLTNLLFHLFTVIMVYFFISRLFKNPDIGILSSFMFAIHPVNTEAVTYIAGRADPLGTFFFLASLILYMKFREKSDAKPVLFILSLLFFIIALLTKESVLILPLILIFYDAVMLKKDFSPKKALGLYLPYFLIIAFYAAFRLLILGLPSGLITHPPLKVLLLTTPKIIVLYLWLMFFPFHLHMERLEPGICSIFDPQAISSIIVVISIIWLSFIAYRRSRPVFFCIGFFFLTLLPLTNILLINAPMAEHWLYIPSIGAYAIISLGLIKAWGMDKSMMRQNKIGKAVILIFIWFMVFFMARAFTRNIEWGRPFEFYKSILKYTPDSARARLNLANTYMGIKDYKNARSELLEGLRLNPGNHFGYYSLGLLDYLEGKKADAMKNWRTSLDICPFSENPRLAAKRALYADNSKFNKLLKAIDVNPGNVMAYYKLSKVYLENGLYPEAIVVLDKLLEIRPDYPDAMFNRAWLYSKLGLYEKAIEEYKKVIVITPDDPDLYANMGFCYASLNRPKDAEAHWNKAAELKAKNQKPALDIEDRTSLPSGV